MKIKLLCPLGGDETNDCADCFYSAEYHFLNGECVRRGDENTVCNRGGDTRNDCKHCAAGATNHCVNGKCVLREEAPTKKTFLDIETGDRVIVFDEYSHDYIQHILQIDSIEFDKEYVTETNREGKICYGTDLEADEWGDDYITQVTESNFCGFLEV